ncbi:MAG: hypothetical protein E7016_01700 [Alphaproteobacteria bacterium]|nr:hypothetical protein [Alphaproteobacteria bacterium]
MNKNDLHFFLGGADLEMVTIRKLLEKEGVSYSDAGLVWGASTSKYGDEIEKVAKEGKTPVIVELAVDSKIPSNTVNVDHHNENASKPASIMQVCELLDVEPTREMQLVAANDSGYIPAMIEMGATKEEINSIRYKDRASQGITPDQERQAEQAIAGAREACGVTIIKMPHSKTATVTDRLFNPNKPQNIAVFSEDGEVNYFGPEDICRGLQGNKIGERPASWDSNQTEVLYDHFGGWVGGAGLGKEGGTAFWGGYPDHVEALNFILTKNQEKQKEKSNDKIADVVMAKILSDFKGNKK